MELFRWVLVACIVGAMGLCTYILGWSLYLWLA